MFWVEYTAEAWKLDTKKQICVTYFRPNCRKRYPYNYKQQKSTPELLYSANFPYLFSWNPEILEQFLKKTDSAQEPYGVFQTTRTNFAPFSRPNRPENHNLESGTYSYRHQNRVIPHTPPPIPASNYNWVWEWWTAFWVTDQLYAKQMYYCLY